MIKSKENRKKPLEMYLHIPFCVKKCDYCDFLSGPGNRKAQDVYMEALLLELEARSRECIGYEIRTVFIGGGTPSVVDASWICRLMSCIRSFYCLADDAEITMEVNPGTVNEKQLAVYYEAGINRLSIGLQSAQNQELKVLGRIHTYEQFLDTYYGARRAGFRNLNVDLMSALPGQTVSDWEKTLKAVLSLKPLPEHISAYSLIIEEGTPFWEKQQAGQLKLPDEDTDRELYRLTGRLLGQYGFRRYEISNYAREGYECLHNCGYWRRTEYLGFGIGAASLMKECRFRNGDDRKAYVENPLQMREEFSRLSLEEQMEEFMFLGLRMMEGVSGQAFFDAFQKDMRQVYGPVLKRCQSEGLLEKQGQYYRLTERGIDVSNYVMAQFLFD